MFPSLINCCTIDWFHEWPAEALYNVAKQQCVDVELPNMEGILKITEQTTAGTKETAVSIGQLADLAVELKGSVSGFKV